MRALLLLAVLGFIVLAIWLQGGERSLDFAKPWILRGLNPENAPYSVVIGDVTVDWRNAAELGRLRVANVTLAKRDGSVFAQLPELYVTVDPIGFMPRRRMLHTIILRQPTLFLARTVEGHLELGFEGAPSRMPLHELTSQSAAAGAETQLGFAYLPSLPFQEFLIEGAKLTFTDEAGGHQIVSSPMAFRLARHGRYYDAALAMPLTADEQTVRLSATLLTRRTEQGPVLTLQVRQFPSRMVCMFMPCPEGVNAVGLIDGLFTQQMNPDRSFGTFRGALTTKKLQIKLPELFAEPLKLASSAVIASVDWAGPKITLESATLALEDTTITATADVRKDTDGWYVQADAKTTRLDITKVYKYWPLTMAPDSRTWITNKLKSGYAASGTLKLNMTPADFAAEYFSDASIAATADAREITFEYLPGFPLVEKMNGMAHFTGTTVKVEGGGGTVLSGTAIRKAILWCPELHSTNNPMEATLELDAPATDAVTLLALKHFQFDDHFMFDAKKISGRVGANMTLKFNAFSENSSDDPNAVNLDKVDYDITTTFQDVAQTGLMGSYDVSKLNGSLKADMNGLKLDGSLAVGESGINDISLKQPSGKPLDLSVRARASQSSTNDFSLIYDSAGDRPKIDIRGKRLDASVSYGGEGEGKDSSLLANFPAMKLNINLDELMLAAAMPFRNVVGTLDCSGQRCEAASFTARAGESEVKGGIAKVNGVRQLTMTTADAGSLLKALDLSDRMTGGRYELRGTYDDSLVPPKLNARLIIREFTLKNSQILGRIFSIGSLTGLANALTGSGIAFEKLSAGLVSHKGVITVNKGAARGASMGITVEGTIDSATSKLNLNGAVAPAYAINSILGNIPIIGDIAGGNEGLIAFNYSVNGTFAEPDVGVNPLSGLTPGFLRGIFSVFDEDAAAVREEKGGSALDDTPMGRRKR
jgi:hypothetical protein